MANNIKNACSCGQWKAEISVKTSLKALNPRVCDCSYCKHYPSAVVSDPTMAIHLTGGTLKTNTNGNQLATFYYCDSCGDFLAVGCHLQGVLRGAISATLLGDASELGDVLRIQPRLLNGSDKLKRWEGLWGLLALSHE